MAFPPPPLQRRNLLLISWLRKVVYSTQKDWLYISSWHTFTERKKEKLCYEKKTLVVFLSTLAKSFRINSPTILSVVNPVLLFRIRSLLFIKFQNLLAQTYVWNWKNSRNFEKNTNFKEGTWLLKPYRLEKKINVIFSQKYTYWISVINFIILILFIHLYRYKGKKQKLKIKDFSLSRCHKSRVHLPS